MVRPGTEKCPPKVFVIKTRWIYTESWCKNGSTIGWASREPISSGSFGLAWFFGFTGFCLQPCPLYTILEGEIRLSVPCLNLTYGRKYRTWHQHCHNIFLIVWFRTTAAHIPEDPICQFPTFPITKPIETIYRQKESITESLVGQLRPMVAWNCTWTRLFLSWWPMRVSFPRQFR